MEFNMAKFMIANLNKFKFIHPSAFDRLDRSRNFDIEANKPHWNDVCYMPYYCIENHFDNEFYGTNVPYSFILSIASLTFPLYNWRFDKKIYKFDTNLAEGLLNRSSVDKNLISKFKFSMLCMPKNCFIIQAPIYRGIAGAIISTNVNKHLGATLSVNLLEEECIYDDKYCKNNSYAGIAIEIPIVPKNGCTIEDCINEFEKLAKDQFDGFPFNKKERYEIILNIFTLLFYLNSDDCILCDNDEQSKIYKQRNPQSRIKDRLGEVEIIDVRSKYGNRVNKNVEYYIYLSNNPDKVDLIIRWDLDFEHQDEDNTNIKADTKNDIDCNAMVQKLKSENLQLLKKVNMLNSEILRIGRELNKAKKDYDELYSTTENDRRELADLRELIFNSQNPTLEDKEDESIKLPYYTSKKITVFGGFINWSTRIKNMLPNVRFVDKGAVPNADLVKNSDVIWIQSNAISHSFYYTIINAARTYNIPVRYFAYASARKCAEQFVKEDSK